MTTKAKMMPEKPAVELKRDLAGQPTDCVVDDGTAHVGRAVNGRVCSAHAMHYDRNGRPRK